MTASAAEHPFSFESSFDPNDPRDRSVKRPSKFGIREDHFFVVFGLLGGLLLFWKYTIALGATMLAVTTFLWAMRERSRQLRVPRFTSKITLRLHVGQMSHSRFRA